MAYATQPSLTFDQVPGSLPTVPVPEDVDLSSFITRSETALQNLENAELAPDALWRDFFALTGSLRTFNGPDAIRSQWKESLSSSTLKLGKVEEPRVTRMTMTHSWVDVCFAFVFESKDGEGGEQLKRNGFGILSFVPGSGGQGENGSETKGWKLWMIRTMLENFEGCGDPDDPSPIFKTPLKSHSGETGFEVIIIGAGQCGLSLAGRLGALRINYLLLEKEAEIGYSWTGKYDSVRQHTVKEMNNLPFERTFRADDPILLPAKTVARGFREFAEKYRINIWLGAETETCIKLQDGWELNVSVGGEVRKLKTRHLVCAMGGGVSVPNPPAIRGRETFKGEVPDLATYKNSRSWKSKKGIVVGSGTSAHDVAQDMLDAGLSEVTMVQRGRTPVFPVEWMIQGQSMVYNTDIPTTLTDRLSSILPLKIERETLKANIDYLITTNSARFDALEKAGFRVDREACLHDLLVLRGGGYYIDVGTSQRIADGDIKVKSGIKISNFTENGLEFEDGEVVEADVVIFATGYERDIRRQAARIVGDEIAGALEQSRILDKDGEVSHPMVPGAEHLWVLRGAVNEARFFSRFIALQIQAELLGKPLPDCARLKGSAKLGL